MVASPAGVSIESARPEGSSHLGGVASPRTQQPAAQGSVDRSSPSGVSRSAPWSQHPPPQAVATFADSDPPTIAQAPCHWQQQNGSQNTTIKRSTPDRRRDRHDEAVR